MKAAASQNTKSKLLRLDLLKIGFVLDDSLDKTDGVQQYILTLGRWMSAQGHQVHYLVGETTRTDVVAHSLSKNVKVRFNRNKMSIPLPANRQRIKQLLETEQYDVLHIQMPYSPQLAGRIIKLAPKATAIIGTFHILPYGYIEAIGTKMLSMFMSRSGKRFDTLLSVSGAAHDFAKRWYGIETKILPNVIDRTLYKAKHIHHKGFKIVFLGRLVARKGCMNLLDAISLLPESIRSQTQVFIGGTGSLQRRLVQQAESLNIHNQVFFMGYIDEIDKAAFLGQADIAVFPSLGGESFGIVLLEAMAAGAGVVIGGDNPGYASVLGSIPKSLIEPRPRKIAERIELLLRDTELKARVHEQQQILVSQYDVSAVAPQLITIYNRAIAKRGLKGNNSRHD
ncbi:MAG: glycosyltransferase family 4 protein [Candidatus Saccharimonadales bacterium]